MNQASPLKANLKNLAMLWQALILVCSLSGVAVNLSVAPAGYERFNLFSYYTIQSNLLVAAAMLLSLRCLWASREEPPALVLFKSGAMLWILVTGIVFQLLLADKWTPQGVMVFVNLSLHYFTPASMILNWLLFEKKGQYQFVYALAWLSYPLLYVLGSWVRGGLTGFYPYWFFNPVDPYPEGAGSLAAMLGVVGLLVVGFFALGLMIILVDRLIARFTRGERKPTIA